MIGDFQYKVLEVLVSHGKRVRQGVVVSELVDENHDYTSVYISVSDAVKYLAQKRYVRITKQGAKKFLNVTNEGKELYIYSRMKAKEGIQKPKSTQELVQHNEIVREMW